ncbi:hypothetical protein BGZ93_000433 [Podila epicladia]|nr:hypothetical protein BGZ92_010084 [Podila epicladia]KAG0085836.1 hypothetical protein BGZ93_000433 [Podila epicladia]
MVPTLKWKRSKSSLYQKEPMPPSSSSSSSSSPPTTLQSLLQKTKDSASANSNTSRISSKDRKNKAKHPPQIVSSALIIPEVVLSIACFLNRSTLARCARVCKYWNSIFQPLLFRYIESTDFDRPDFVHAFQEHSRFATSIEWIQEPIRPPSPKKHAWHKIFRRRADKPPAQKQFEQLEQSLAGETPALETLSVRIQNQDPNIILRLPASTVINLQISTRGYPAKKPKVYMEDILDSYPHLVNLTLEGLFTLTTRLVHSNQGSESTIYPPPALLMNDQGNNTIATLLPIPPTVIANAHPSGSTPAGATGSGSGSGEGMLSDPAVMSSSSSSSSISSLSTTSSISSTVSTSSTTRARAANTRTSSLIETLKLRLVDVSQEGLLALSAFLPRLESLLIEEFLVPDMMIKIYRWTWSTEFIHSLKESFPHLRVLRLAIPFDVIKEDTIVEILKAFPNLTTVGFRNSYFGQRALKTMQECCKNVDCLDISFGFSSREFKRDLLLFLQANTSLREFEADGMIFHLDRSAEDEEDDDMVVGGPNHSVPQPLVLPWACTKLEKLVCGFQGTDSAIFQFLSRFPLLENLTVTYPSLNLSPVESTLGWLVKSNKIKYFWFSQYRNLPMDKSSIQWMLTHWPNLKTLHVAGGGVVQREVIRQMFKDAQRLSVNVEYDRM